MKTFLCSNGALTTADAPKLSGTYAEIAKQFGFALAETIVSPDEKTKCLLFRPINNQEVYLTIHGQERSMDALVIWEYAANPTLILAPTPFDLAVAVEYIARFEKAMYEVRHYSGLREE